MAVACSGGVFISLYAKKKGLLRLNAGFQSLKVSD
jgi:hypothetical protein